VEDRDRKRRNRILAGAAIWAAAIGAVGWAVRAHASELKRPAGEVGRYLVGRPAVHTVELEPPLRVGDPLLDEERGYLGRVVAIRDAAGREADATWHLDDPATVTADVALDPEVELPPDPRFRSRTAPRDSRWILQTLLPEHKRQVVLAELESFTDAHEREITAFLRPLAEDVIAHGMGVLEANLAAAIEAHDAEIQALVDDHRSMVKDEIVPVLKERLGPSAKEKAEPLLTEIGRELWVELPMWSLGWRAFVDTIPGTRQDRVDEWWAQFVEEKAIPIVREYEDDLIIALEELIDEGLHDPEVRRTLSDATKRLAADPAFKRLIRGVLEDALVRPFDVRALFKRLLADEGHQARLRQLERAFAPALQRVGRLLTIDPETGRIDPDLARVLRRVVFNKDARWVELVPPDDEAPEPPRDF